MLELLIILLCATIPLFYFLAKSRRPIIPISVNYHFSRKCNYECGFCFHTDKNSDMATLEEAKLVLAKLAFAGMKKLNFAGGNPNPNPRRTFVDAKVP
jgi:radical S-adenosyl methionine domain-containing protein 2